MADKKDIEVLAACRLTEQQIADVLDINLGDLKLDRKKLAWFREAIRIGRAKGEAELRGVLYRRAKGGNIGAISELLRREKEQDSD